MNQTTKQIMAALVLVAAFTTSLWALDPKPCPAGYYNAALNKYGQNLISALYGIVGSHTNIGYDGLLEAYADTDSENGYLIDMYSTYDKYTWDTKRCGNYDAIGDCWNREHSFPKSWWGGGTDARYSDIFHLYPTDGYVNNQRSNYPFGECANGARLQVTIGGKTYVGKGKLGDSTFDGYTDKVFEPDDEYKGDFARSYFYVATAYYNSTGWTGDMLTGSSNHFPFFTDWAMNLLLKWHRQDPVSQKEITRNNYAHSWQGNRNPYIDHPELAEHIWGNKSTVAWTGSESTDPALISPSAGTTIDMGIVHTGTPATQTLFVRGVNLTKSVSVSVSYRSQCHRHSDREQHRVCQRERASERTGCRGHRGTKRHQCDRDQFRGTLAEQRPVHGQLPALCGQGRRHASERIQPQERQGKQPGTNRVGTGAQHHL